MAKNIPKQTQTTKRLVLVTILLISVVFFGFLIWAGWQTNKVNYAYNQAQIDQTREIALQTVKLSKTPVPVDAKTGDLYFAHEKLYVPAIDDEQRLTFGYLPSTTGNSNDYDLTVSSDFAYVHAANNLYAATDIDGIYKAIPELQACQRGVRVVEKQTPQLAQDSSLELRGTISVGMGRTVYLYAETRCSDLEDVITHLKALKAY